MLTLQRSKQKFTLKPQSMHTLDNICQQYELGLRLLCRINVSMNIVLTKQLVPVAVSLYWFMQSSKSHSFIQCVLYCECHSITLNAVRWQSQLLFPKIRLSSVNDDHIMTFAHCQKFGIELSSNVWWRLETKWMELNGADSQVYMLPLQARVKNLHSQTQTQS